MFNISTLEYDFEIYELSQPIEFGPRAQPVSLVDPSDPVERRVGTTFVVSGWGIKTMTHPYVYPKRLKAVKVPFIPKKTCIQIYKCLCTHQLSKC